MTHGLTNIKFIAGLFRKKNRVKFIQFLLWYS